MFFNLSPFSYLYFTFYFTILFSVLSCDDFLTFWLLIEFITLVLIGTMFSIFTNSFSFLISYLFIQSISSFSILLFYVTRIHSLLLCFLLLKLSMFPFHFWYINIVYRFPLLPLFFVSTFHKIPSFALVSFFSIPVTNFFLLSIPITILVSSILIVSSSDFRILIVSSSVGNNSWFFLSILFSYDFFLLYIFFYSLNFYLLLSSLSPYSSLQYSHCFKHQNSNVFILFLLALSGIPPFPLFFLKAFLVYSQSFILPPLCVFFSLVFTFLIVSSYVISRFKLISYRYSLFVYSLN